MALALVDLPKTWSNHDRVDQLTPGAYGSLTRMLPRAVAETGVNFNINSAYRSKAEQVALFTANYRNRGTKAKQAADDRMYGGTAWRWLGGVRVASPDLYGTGTGANHTRGIAIDIVPAAIQSWIQRNGSRFGWSWAEGKRNGEAWHFTYAAAGDQYRGEGTLDHAWVQRIVGASVDGKIGTGTVEKIKAWQKANGLEADGKVGPATKTAMKGGTSGKDETPSAPADGATEAKPAAAVKESTEPAAAPGWMPGANTSQTWDGNTHKATVTKLVLHTTEGRSFPDYQGGKVAPHLTVMPGPADADHIRQHIPTTQSSKALENRAGGVETNNAGVIQIEIIGSCDRAYANANGLRCTEDFTDDDLASVAAVVAWVCEAHGIPLNAGELAWPTSNAAYVDAPQRLGGEEWTEYAGICGHTHVPENEHWDPGAFPVARLLELAGGAPVTAAPTTSTTTTAGGMPTGKALLMQLKDVPDFPLLRTDGHLCYYGDASGPVESVSGKSENSLNPGDIYTSGGKTRSHGLEALQKQLKARGYGVDVDGRWGTQMDNAIDNLQRIAGLTRDKKAGPTTWYAAWLLPIQ